MKDDHLSTRHLCGALLGDFTQKVSAISRKSFDYNQVDSM